MSAVVEICRRLVDGDLLSAPLADEHARRWRQEPGSSDDATAFLNWLAHNNALTPFQVEALQAGHRPPFVLGPYRVFDRLTDSALGHVYRAVHSELELPVSLKVYPPALEDKPAALVRLQREARASVQLDHPNVLRIFQVGRAGKIYFLASQNLAGESIHDWLARDGQLGVVPTCKVVRQAALGLAHLHEQHMVHRNICPQTLWVNDQGAVKIIGLDWVRDTDGSFGIDDAPESGSGHLVGTLSYVAPEQALRPGQPDTRSDIYSLGAVLYQCLTGDLPFPDRKSVADLQSQQNPPRPVRELAPATPDEIAAIALSMLAPQPAARPTLAAVIAATELLLDPGELDLVDADAIPGELLDWLETSAVEEGEALFAGNDFTDWLAED